MTGLVATEVPVATVIPVVTTFGVAFLSRLCPGRARSGRCLGGRCDKVRIATPRPVAFWGAEAKSLGRRPFPLFWLFSSFPLLSKVERPLLSLLRRLELVEERRRLVRSGSSTVGARRRWRARREGPLGKLSPCSPPRCGVLSVVVVIPGCSIPAVRLPADVTTAQRVATSEKASPRSDVTL
ncbi:hypothetical protein Taro_047938 [Colocasia esculenta]|uniref:Uncharacterized protein n=1 Tax=Colocasia esculenta TaxID=4460 RepID=A0A843WUC4_COLES|nr:hypothetical protein [Colocasia esculenta]